MFLFLASSLFFTEPFPVELPRASAYAVRDGERSWVEDRYDAGGLWLSHAVYGRWRDAEGRIFTLAVLDRLPPALADSPDVTRVDYEAVNVAADVRKIEHVRRQVYELSPVEVPARSWSPHSRPRGIRKLGYWQGTNETAIVATFLPEDGDVWYYADWKLAEGDDFEAAGEAFSEAIPEFAERLAKATAGAPEARRRGEAPATERELLRRDVRKSVAAYPEWHFTSSEEFVIVDDLRAGRDFVIAITNEMPALRAQFAAAMPSPLDGSNTLAVARIYRDREDYLACVGADMVWSVACWCPARRSLVASLTESGDLAQLKQSFRHESFHQFLAYAGGMAAAAPWINEGYAEYFEDPSDARLGFALSPEEWDRAERFLPELFKMDYAAFYAGTDEERRFKYRLAWSVARFLEKGAREVPFDPFKDLQRRYMAALVETHDMHRATAAAFPTRDLLERFVSEWRAFCIREGL